MSRSMKKVTSKDREPSFEDFLTKFNSESKTLVNEVVAMGIGIKLQWPEAAIDVIYQKHWSEQKTNTGCKCW